MDDLTLRYYEAEMRYLREAAREFAERFPDRAAMLNLDRVGDRDPYVERLFEGFAFLTGRLREKIDDDLPEMTEGLVSLLWPHYLRTIPSLSIEEISPDYHQMKEVEIVPAGFLVQSQPVGAKQTRCLYRTTRDLTLYPLQLSAATLHNEADGRAIIRLRFACGSLADWKQISLASLPLYFHADAPVACALHLALTKQAQQLWYRLPGQDRIALNAHFSPQGFAEDDRLWPKGETAFSGYQLLLEYFTFREKFMGVILRGLETMSLPQNTPWFEIDIVLASLWPQDLPFSVDNIRLHCTPVINLFNLESDPLHLSGFQNEYLLRPLRLQDGHTEIYAVEEVSYNRSGSKQRMVPFSSFRHQGGMLRHTAPERYYHTRVKRGPSGMHDTWLIFGGEEFERHPQGEAHSPAIKPDEQSRVLSLRLTGTNGQLPRKALRSTLLDSTVNSTTIAVKVRNLCAPTLPCYPPTADRFHWRVLSHLGSNFLSMMDNPEVLRGTLALYDWTDNEMNRRRLEAIVDVKHHLLERFTRGRLLRGVAIDITINSDGFSGEGDICLFGELLHRFFALYADIHLFNQLTLILQPSGKSYQWQENHSQRIPG